MFGGDKTTPDPASIRDITKGGNNTTVCFSRVRGWTFFPLVDRPQMFHTICLRGKFTETMNSCRDDSETVISKIIPGHLDQAF